MALVVETVWAMLVPSKVEAPAISKSAAPVAHTLRRFFCKLEYIIEQPIVEIVQKLSTSNLVNLPVLLVNY
jgi:hypothetical protein